MASSPLFPPNRFTLSDQVIGGVVQRIAPLHNGANSSCFIDATAAGEAKRTVNTTSQRRVKVPVSRRERCRINEARYRKRQREHTDSLCDSIQHLQEEIEQLETKRQNVMCSTPTDRNMWVIATEYFRLFRHGYSAPLHGSSSTAPSAAHAQLEFLKTSMALDVPNGDSVGAEELLEHWRLLSIYFRDVRVQPKRMEQVADNSLLVSTTVSVTISENTLRNVFPHLVCCREESNEEEWSPLAGRLVNQRLVLRGSVHFDWDEARGRVVRVESKMDMLMGMMKLVGNFEDLARVFSKATLTPEGRFG